MNEQTYEIIDQYLNGELSSKEVVKIEQRLKTDAHFAQTVAIQRQLFRCLNDRFEREKEEIVLKETLSQISGQHFSVSTSSAVQNGEEAASKKLPFEETATKRHSNVVRLLFTVAAVAAILLVFVWAPWQQSLLDQYYSTPQMALTARGGDDACDAAAIDQQYRDRLFAEALPLIETCLQAKPDDAELRFAKAICLLETGDTKTALQTLDGLKGNATFQHEALWYSAMAHLKRGDRETAAKLLQKIPASADHGKDASELLKKL